MRRWLTLAVWLYPPRWRARYGEEFRALLEDLRPGFREWADVLRGAVIMQIANGTAFMKLTAALAVAGALVALAASFGAPRRYISSAAVEVSPAQDDADEYTRNHFEQMKEEILSRSQLASLILQPRLDLYRSERSRLSMDQVILQMRRDLQLRPVSANTYRITFAYPDAEKARAITQQLATMFYERNIVSNRHRARAWHEIFPQTDPPPGQAVTVVEAASLPDRPVGPNRLLFVSGGLLLGVLAAISMWRPAATLRLAAASFAGGILVYGLSFLYPTSFTSIATMRLTTALVPEQLAGVTSASLAERISKTHQDVLGDANLTRLITAPALNLYKEGRTSEALLKLRRNLQIEPVPGDPRALRISFSYADRFKAKQLVDNVVTGFMVHTARNQRALLLAPGVNPLLRTIYEHSAGATLELLDPASLPEFPDGPNRLLFAAAGAALGLLAGLLASRPPAASSPVRAYSSLACWLL